MKRNLLLFAASLGVAAFWGWLDWSLSASLTVRQPIPAAAFAQQKPSETKGL